MQEKCPYSQLSFTFLWNSDVWITVTKFLAHLFLPLDNFYTGHILYQQSFACLLTPAPLNAKYFKIISWITVTAAYLNLVFTTVQLFPPLLIFKADWKIMAPTDLRFGKSWDLSCRFHSWLFSEEEVRACVCLSAFAKRCGIFLFAFVSSLCVTVLISTRIFHHSTLCLFEMKASCTCGGHWVLFYTETWYLPGQICKPFITCGTNDTIRV